MAIVDIIKYNGEINELVWKYPSEEIGTWTQLVVNETQEAILLKDGVVCDIFHSGKYTLDTKNIPILNKIINIPFGGESPYKVEIWFVNKKILLDIKWGTSSPIQLQDAKYGIFISVRSFGQFGIQISDARIFFLKLIGTKINFTTYEISSFFKGMQLTKIKDMLSSYLIKKEISILEINAYINELSEYAKKEMEEIFTQYGIQLINFYINDINIPEDDSGVMRLKEALAKKAEMNIVGFDYTQERTFDTLEGAAKNTSSNSSHFIGSGIGMAMGVNLGNSFSEKMNKNLQNSQENGNNIEKIKCRRCKSFISKRAKFCPECGELQVIKCHHCGAIIRDENAKFCFDCGNSLKKVCENCGNILEQENIKFCPECGQKIE